MKITTLTAAHVLRYLLASEGLELSYGPIATSWPIFKRFLGLPSEASDDVASFQVGHGDTDDPRFLQAAFIRQMTDDAAGFAPGTRSTVLTYSWEFTSPPGIDPVELWSSDHPTLAAFVEAVESHKSFKALVDLPPEDATVEVDEPSDDAESQ